MVQPNLFPAILIAGAPNSGKSVLSHLLTQRLRAEGIEHYLLRAAPDGEGDWFQDGALAHEKQEQARLLRQSHKRSYTAEMVRHMCAAIHNRALPLLVDIGGKPRGDQLEILRACTHSILLYRTPAEKAEWQFLLGDLNLLPVAELRSSLDEPDALLEDDLVLQAVIGGLQRDPNLRRVGLAFEELARLVAGICRYERGFLEVEHTRRAPYPVLFERDLARLAGARSEDENPHWEPGDLARLLPLLRLNRPAAIYGRGPVWLAAALAVLAMPHDLALFDTRYSWLTLADLQAAPNEQVQFELQPNLVDATSYGASPARWLEVTLRENTIEPREASCRHY